MPSPAAIQTLSRVLGVSLDAIFAAITGPAQPQAPEPRFSAPAASAGWVRNSAYDSANAPVSRSAFAAAAGGSAAAGAVAGGGAAGGAVAGGAAAGGGAALPESISELPVPVPLSAPAPAGAAPTGRPLNRPAPGDGPAPGDTTVGGVSAAVDVLLRLPADQRLAALAEVQMQVVDSVVAERLEQGRHR